MSFEKLIRQSITGKLFYYSTALAVSIVFSRGLGAAGSGGFFYAVNNFSLAVLLLGLSLESSFVYYGKRGAVQAHALLVLSLLWSGIAAICSFAFFYFFEHRSSAIPFYALLFVGGTLLSNFSAAVFMVHKQFGRPFWVLGGVNVLLLIVVWLAFTHDTNSIVVLSFFIATAAGGIVLFVLANFRCVPLFSFKWVSAEMLRSLFTYSIIAFAANLIFFLECRIDYWFVYAKCSAQDLGNYVQASRIGQFLLIVPQTLAAVVFAEVSGNRSFKMMQENFARLVRIFLQLFVLAGIAIAICGNVVVAWVLGAGYDKVSVLLLCLLPGIACLSVLSLCSAVLGGVNKVRVTVKGSAIGLVIVLLGNVLLLPLYSVYVAAFVSVVGYAVNMLYSLYHVRKEGEKGMPIFRFMKSDWQWLGSLILYPKLKR
ncbi:MAG: polysaccharide biosynthesis C-terminal domain-containing protein [Bacteroidota bacterium]|nr:polysaccharide biosynthesis C-terminal domain-containing protein [Bacteroidota bacterium]